MNWQYKAIKFATRGVLGGKLDENEIEMQLNELGRKGWELTAVFDAKMEAGRTRDTVAVLERPE